MESASKLKLPTSLLDRGDLLSLIREVNSLSDFFVGANARQTGSPMQIPKTTRLLDQLVQLNQINLLEASSRKQLAADFEAILKTAPSVHMSFAMEPSPRSIEPLITWLRQNIHPQLLLQVGLQPQIAAGCILRTSNKIFDFSIRTYLEKQSQYLTALVAGTVNGQ
ncbi:MAG TPA: hypothetical protein VFP35_00035 [Candidatus Saccharimonadales bacterium]|nr:hypothetical protein [Candidatus Saccharimonadales bacterium]